MIKVHLAAMSPLVTYSCTSKYLLEAYPVLEHNLRYIKIMNNSDHAIIDSGVFSMLFGKDKDKKVSEQSMFEYTAKYCDFIEKTGYKHAVVEMDVQSLLGFESMLYLRAYMKKRIKNPMICVPHTCDNEQQIIKTIEEEDYIGIPFPDSKVNRGDDTSFIDFIYRHSIKKGKKVHLLGTTSVKNISRYSNAFSCDSTSWLSQSKYSTDITFKKRIIKAPDGKTRAITSKNIHGIEIVEGRMNSWN